MVSIIYRVDGWLRLDVSDYGVTSTRWENWKIKTIIFLKELRTCKFPVIFLTLLSTPSSKRTNVPLFTDDVSDSFIS